MKEYEYLFATTLHEKLKEKIIGRIFCKVNTMDQLYVTITTYGDVKYETSVEDFSKKVLNGWTTDYAAYEITEQYRKSINKRYFIC